MLYVGIDNGLRGGLSAVDKNEKLFTSRVMPTIDNKKKEYDIKKIVDGLNNLKFITNDNLKVILESAHPRPVSGKRACFSTGYGYGVIQGILNTLDIEYEIVTPQKWMKSFGFKSSQGKGSVKYCLTKYPYNDWKETKRCKNTHHGKTDSACLALYGVRNKC